MMRPIKRLLTALQKKRQLSVILTPVVTDKKVEGPVLALVCRNEMVMLEFFFSYYRKLGIKTFVVIDNCSTDGTEEFLRRQPDTLVYSLAYGYFDSHRVLAINHLLKRYAMGHWALHVDIDELLWHPRCEQGGLPSLLAELDQRGIESVWTPLVDMYPERYDAPYGRGESFWQHSKYYDDFAGYSFQELERFYDFRGGVRARLFAQSDQKGSLQCSKTSLIKYGGSLSFANDHWTTNPVATKASVIAPLLHFKFIGDFEERVRRAVKENQHWQDSAEYRAYARTIKTWQPGQKLTFSGSKAFTDSHQVVDELYLLCEEKLTQEMVRLH